MSYRLVARDLLRTTLLDAALAALGQRPWSEVTMAEVASAAGTSRQTLYSEFGSRAALAQAVVAREGERFLAAAATTIEHHRDDPPHALTRAFAEFLTAAADNPLVQAIVAPDGDGALLPLITTRGGPLVEGVTARLSDALRAAWPALGRRDAQPQAECLVRLAISHAALPLRSPRRTARDVTALLGPCIERALDTGDARAAA